MAGLARVRDGFRRETQDRQYGYCFHSYDFAARQPSIRVFVKVELGSLRDTDNIDKWLVGPLAVDDFESYVTDRQMEGNRRSWLARAVIDRALILYGDLLRGSVMPCFERGQVLAIRACAHRPEDREAIVLLPIVDHVPAATFGKLLAALVQLIVKDMVKKPETRAIAAVLEKIDRLMVKPVAAISPIELTSFALCQLAYQANIPFRHIGGGLVKLGTGSRGMITRGSAILADAAIGAQVSRDKQIAADLLSAAGFPAPEHIVVETKEQALAAARKLGWPLVVKPSNRDRSEGVTIGIEDETTLASAFERANRESRLALVERMIPGACHRILIADGQLMYAVKRHPKGVIGNGSDTIAKLIADANALLLLKPRWKRMKEIPLDQEAIDCLAERGLTLESIPAEGDRVSVRKISSDQWGGSIETLSDSIHPDNVELAKGIANLLGLKIAGIDLMSPDITRPWHENGGIVTEVNFQPQFAIFGREAEMARMMPAIVEGDGRIPVHLVTGGSDALGFAIGLRGKLATNGRRAYLTASALTLGPNGDTVPLAFSTLFDRALALSLRQDVDELVLIGTAAELIEQGLAMDRIDTAYILDRDPLVRQQTRADLGKRFAIAKFLGPDG